jgi:hypothetical protein
MDSKTQDNFPVITAATFGCSKRGLVLFLALAGVGRVEITAREMMTSRRFARAVYRQTKVEIKPMDDRVWRRWLTDCVRTARAKGGHHVA